MAVWLTLLTFYENKELETIRLIKEFLIQSLYLLLQHTHCYFKWPLCLVLLRSLCLGEHNRVEEKRMSCLSSAKQDKGDHERVGIGRRNGSVTLSDTCTLWKSPLRSWSEIEPIKYLVPVYDTCLKTTAIICFSVSSSKNI